MKFVTWQLLAPLALGCVYAAPSRADISLGMQADTPEVSIESRSARRGFLRLPALQYSFAFNAQCMNDFMPISLQLSVADTRKTLQSDEIEADAATMISLKIPANQIAPVAIEGFCEQPDPQESEGRQRSEQTTITITAALSAQASLRCANESDAQTVYVSRPLDVTLTCKTQADSTSTR